MIDQLEKLLSQGVPRMLQIKPPPFVGIVPMNCLYMTVQIAADITTVTDGLGSCFSQLQVTYHALSVHYIVDEWCADDDILRLLDLAARETRECQLESMASYRKEKWFRFAKHLLAKASSSDERRELLIPVLQDGCRAMWGGVKAIEALGRAYIALTQYCNLRLACQNRVDERNLDADYVAAQAIIDICAQYAVLGAKMALLRAEFDASAE